MIFLFYQTQTNLENQIQQRFKTPAAGKPINPYQGLKQFPQENK